jgi:ABC-2 type transport system permease protein
MSRATNSALRRNAGLIARREYLDRVRTRSFVVTTAIIAVVAIGVALAPIGLRSLDRGSVVRIGVAASEPALATTSISVLDGILNRPPEGVDPATWKKPYAFEAVASETVGLDAVGRGSLGGLLSASRRPDGGLTFTYHTPGPASSLSSQVLQYGSFGVAILDWSAKLPPGSAVPFRTPSYTVVSTSGATEGGRPIGQQEAASRTVVATILIVLIFITLTIYGMWVATSVAAEKSTRVMEMLISAATPRQLLVGKVLGVGGAGLTQYVAILIPASVVVLFQDRIAAFILGPAPAAGEGPLVGLSLPILAAFGAFFLLGFVLYALLYAAAGSLVSRQDDVQQLALPLSLVSMASYVVAVFGLGAIGSAPVVILSFVPFSSPFVMLARLILGRVQPWEVALSMAILAASSAVVLWLAARIYATGVLLYGQRAGIRAFIRAARTAGR